MVEQLADDVDRVFRALGSEPRRQILRRTAAKPCSVTQLSEDFDMSLAAVSKHVRVLADAGLLVLEREGRVQWCRLEPAALDVAGDAIDELRRYWDRRLDALEKVLAKRRR